MSAIMKKNDKSQFKPNLLCCVCLTKSNTMYTLDFKIRGDWKCLIISDLLNNTLPNDILNDDILPNKVCKSCLEVLYSYYLINERFLHGQTLLKAYLKNKDCNEILNYSKNKPAGNEFEVEEHESSDEASNPSVASVAEDKKHSCNLCGKVYKQAGTLKAHMRIHTGSKPFLCSLCGKGFRQAAGLTYHTRSHKDDKPYICDICGKAMSMQSHLIEHLRTHTGERPFKCDECGKGFSTSSRLTRHKIIHSDLKPFTCTICQKSFNRSSSLKTHQKIHTGDKQHVCVICNQRFIHAHPLRLHMNVHMRKNV